MLKIWGRANSSNVKKPLWACAEMGVPYERIDAGLQFGVVNTDEYKAMNPMGLIPVIDDEGFVLWESNAIVRYLCAKHGKDTFWPSDLKIRAQADRWMDWQCTTMGPALGTAFLHMVRLPNDKRDPALVHANVPKAADLWRVVDRQLAQTKWLAGEHFTMGDMPLGILAYTWMELKLEDYDLAHHRVKLDNVWRWYDQLQAMKHYRDIVQIGLT
ncbi:MAG: glutathione S-transferase family protein [Betaproteobacteria bacterium]|nr:MAG: glutathione S-transferase family protein [Betaproteobacteria bacterium]TAG49027.1 MAG: glutathione S-transferase family protein [Betaproteobacteria bacterium]